MFRPGRKIRQNTRTTKQFDNILSVGTDGLLLKIDQPRFSPILFCSAIVPQRKTRGREKKTRYTMSAGLHRLWVCIFPILEGRLRRAKRRGFNVNGETHICGNVAGKQGTIIQRDYAHLVHSLVTMLMPTSSCSLPHSSEIMVLAIGDTPDSKPISKLRGAWAKERNGAKHVISHPHPSPHILLVAHPTVPIAACCCRELPGYLRTVVHAPGRKRSPKSCITTKIMYY